jgi:hypothetical protein
MVDVETSQDQSALLSSALSYMGRGWEVIDLPPGTKNPGRPGWQNERYDEETIRRRVYSGPRNLSVLLGEPSGGLVDVDLDCPEAQVLAGRFLPPTGACLGRYATRSATWSSRERLREWIGSTWSCVESFETRGGEA